MEVQNFEITIRLLGGLLSSYQLTGDKRLLHLAEDLGNRLLPVFNSATGLPYRYVNLKTGKVRGNITNPAEAGTLLIEFGTLSKLTHKPIFYDKAKRALVGIYNRRSSIGLVGTWINVETGEWTDTDSHISGAIDSYYEYLLKCAILFDDQDCRRMWTNSVAAINRYLGVWARRHEYRRTDGDNLWRVGRVLSGCPSVVRRPRPRGTAAGLFFQDVVAARNRARRIELPLDADSFSRLPSAAGNCRIDLLPLSLHEQR